MIRRMVILGASGDLISRYLLPAVARLFEVGELFGDFKILGMARDDWHTDAFRSHIRKKLEIHAAAIPPRFRESLISCLEYHKADVTNPSEVAKALAKMNRTGLRRLMVVDRDRLVGIIALKDLLSFLSLRVELEEG